MVESFKSCGPTTPLYFDTETTNLNPRTGRLVAMQFHFAHQTYIVDMRRLPRTQYHTLRPMFLEKHLVVGHNLKFDLQWVFKYLRILPDQVWDTMIAEQCIRGLGLSDGRSQTPPISFGLKELAHTYTNIDMSKDEREWFFDLDTRREQRADEDDEPFWYTPWNAPFPEAQIKYMERDVEVLGPILYEQESFYNDHPVQQECFNLERLVVPALAHVEFSGVPINTEQWMAEIDKKEIEAKELEGEVIKVFGAAILSRRIAQFDQDSKEYLLWEGERDAFLQYTRDNYKPLTGWGEYKVQVMKAWRAEHPNPGRPYLDQTININSTTQLMQAFQEMRIPAKDTSTPTLERLEEQYPEVRLIMDYRRAIKFVQSFGKSIMERVERGRIHPDYVQIGASTERMSCTQPNWQQIPSRSETGRALRSSVQAPEGWVMLDADFSSQELCILAELSGDCGLLNVFVQGEDPHTRTAQLMFRLGKSVDVRREGVNGVPYRDIAKTINYGIAYGMTKYRLGRLLKIGYDEAQSLIDQWYEAYPDLHKWLEKMKERPLRGTNYSETLAGWRRYYRPLPSEPVFVNGAYHRQNYKEFRERHREWEMELNHLQNMHMNTPIQGLGAAITKKALTNFFRRVILDSEYQVSSDVQIIAVVHDEILVLCKEEKSEEYAVCLGQCMDDAERYYLPTVQFPRAGVHIGKSWEH